LYQNESVNTISDNVENVDFLEGEPNDNADKTKESETLGENFVVDSEMQPDDTGQRDESNDVSYTQ